MSHSSIPCIIYRGGTSRGVFFHEKDLPSDLEKQRQIFIRAIGSTDATQVDGLGGGSSHTSKVAIISPSTDSKADVNYTFVQLGLNESIVDYNGTCGNLMSAVGVFAIDEGLVKAVEPVTEVRVYNTNIDKYLCIKVPVEDGQAKITGDFYMSGLKNPGAKITVDILNPGGSTTKETLPSGPTYEIKTEKKTYETSFVDVVNPFVYVEAQALEVKGNAEKKQLSSSTSFMQEMEKIRALSAVNVGLAKDVEQVSAAVPKIAIVSEPQDYLTVNGELIKEDEVDIVTKMISVGQIHNSFAVSGLMNIASAVLLEGTIPHSVARSVNQGNDNQYIVRVGHANGVARIKVTLTPDMTDIASITLDRHARRIMKGELFAPTF